MNEIKIEEDPFKQSIYQKYEQDSNLGEKLGKELETKLETKLDELKTIFNKHYLGPLDVDKIPPEIFLKDAPDIIASGITLSRMRTEIYAIVLGDNIELSETQQSIINTLVGEGSKFKEVWKKFYEGEEQTKKDISGKEIMVKIEPLMTKAQSVIRENFPTCEGTFDIMCGVDTADGVSILKKGNVTQNILHQLKEKFSKKDFKMLDAKRFMNDDEAILAMNIGILLSNPHVMGTTLALMGDPKNEGKLEIQEMATPGTWGGLGHSAGRAAMVIGAIAAVIAVGYFASIAIPITATFVIPAALVGTIAASIALAVVSSTMKVVIDNEWRYTENIENGVNNFSLPIFAGVYLAPKDVIKFIMGPYYKAKAEVSGETLCNGAYVNQNLNIVKDKVHENIKEIKKMNAKTYHYQSKNFETLINETKNMAKNAVLKLSNFFSSKEKALQ